MSKSTYTVTSPIMHGRRFDIGDPITLPDEEAKRLSGYVDLNSKREADLSAAPGATKTPPATTQNSELQGQIKELEGANADLAKRLDSSSFEIADLKQQIADLQAENEQLKAAAKPAAKGAK